MAEAVGRQAEIPVGAARWDAARGERVLEDVKRGVLRRRRVRVAAAASSALLVLAVAMLWMFRPLSSPEPLVVRDTGSLRFADGSRVELTSATSTVELGPISPSYTELVLERGSARFDVTPNPKRRFAVRAGNTRIEVLGTCFSVERRDPRVRVAVERGRVRVIWSGGERVLEAGEAGLFPPATGSAHAEERGNDVEPAQPAPAPSAAPAAPDQTALRKRFLDLARGGDYQKAYGLMREEPRVVTNSAEDLMLAADAARLSGHPERAPEYLRRITSQHPRDSRAPLAAFTLGRILLTQLGQPAEAERAFAQARQLAPAGQLAESALARQAEAASRAGMSGRARALALEYSERYPGSKQLEAVRRYGGLEPITQ